MRDWSTNDIEIERYVPKGEISILDILQDDGVVNYSCTGNYEAHKLILEVFRRQAKEVPTGCNYLLVIDVIGYSGHFALLVNSDEFVEEDYLFPAYKDKETENTITEIIPKPTLEELFIRAEKTWKEFLSMPEWIEEDYTFEIFWKNAYWTVFFFDETYITLSPQTTYKTPNHCKGDINILPSHRTWYSLVEEIATTYPSKID